MKLKKRNFLVGLLVLLLVPFGVCAESKTVTTEGELRSALEDTTITEIILGDTITTNGKINITRDVTINGNGKQIIYEGKFFETLDGEGVTENTVWSKKSSDGTEGAVYVLHVYKANVTIKDISLENGNRGLLVNGGTVTLDGIIGLAGNGFHPIEVSSGKGVTEQSVLKIAKDAIVLNGNEDLTDDTIDGTVYIDNYDATKLSKIIKVKNEEEIIEEYKNSTRITNEDLNVNLLYSIDDAENKEIPVELIEYVKATNKLLALARFDEEGNIVYGWELDSKNITDPTIVLNTNITFTLEAPESIKNDVSKSVANHQNVSYLNFEHEGALPGLSTIIYNVASKYETGTKLYVAHFNETTKLLEEAKEVTVDESGFIEFDITECSSYVLYTGVETPAATDEVVENVNTGDINIALIGGLIIASIAGLAITSKKIVSKVR